MHNFNKKLIIYTIITFLFSFFLQPFIIFWLGYLAGLIVKITIGMKILETFSAFGILFPLNKIPVLTGTIAWFASFFKDNIIFKNNI